MEFRIGDTVEIIDIQSGEDWRGERGTVVAISSKNKVGIRFDKFRSIRHNLDGACPKGYGWWYSVDKLRNLSSCPPLGIEDLI